MCGFFVYIKLLYGQGTEILESLYFPREPLAEGTPDCTKAEAIA